jgi:phage baseplate assembly protein W
MANYNWQFPLSKGPQGYFAANTDIEQAAKEDIKNLLLCIRGERAIFVDYGTDIPLMLFDQMDEQLKSRIRITIIRAVNKWIPGVSIDHIDVTFKEDITPSSIYSKINLDDNEVMISIFYNINVKQFGKVIPLQNITLVMAPPATSL